MKRHWPNGYLERAAPGVYEYRHEDEPTEVLQIFRKTDKEGRVYWQGATPRCAEHLCLDYARSFTLSGVIAEIDALYEERDAWLG